MSLYGKHFYHSHLRNYVVAFGSMFSNIEIHRKDSVGDEIHRETVPLTYAKKEKFVQRLIQDSNLERDIALKLPRMAFTMDSIQYAPERKISSKRKMMRGVSGNANSNDYVYNPVPYDIPFDLTIAAKSQDVALQIIEQIVPFFTPHYPIAMKGLGDPEIIFDVPISLISVNVDDSFEGRFEDNRTQIWDLGFVLKGFLFGPVRRSSIIKTVEVDLIDQNKSPNKFAEMEIVPYIDGVALDDILATDDYSIMTTIMEEFDGINS